MPDGSGLDLLRTLRQNGNLTPAILLTANDLELDEVTGLEAGADDYITKPFNILEVKARIKAIMRRTGKKEEKVDEKKEESKDLNVDSDDNLFDLIDSMYKEND